MNASSVETLSHHFFNQCLYYYIFNHCNETVVADFLYYEKRLIRADNFGSARCWVCIRQWFAFFIQGSVGYHLAQVCMGVSSLLPTHTHIYPCQGPTMGLYPYGLSNLTSQNSASKYHRQVVSTLWYVHNISLTYDFGGYIHSLL